MTEMLRALGCLLAVLLPLRHGIAPEKREIVPEHTALVICDMWDKHWCSGANRRVGLLVKEMEPVIEKARAAGIQIVHAPSDTMDFYKDYPQRQAMLLVPKIELPPARDIPDPPLPIDDKSGGCDTHEQSYKDWTREHPGLSIAPQDRISDNGR
ncbi:MAG: hypothetical protein JO022_05935, partial [Acidobacteriaceae bacterium]|nr:hypothetical protein [Acidobacteriaceae bacterium]